MTRRPAPPPTTRPVRAAAREVLGADTGHFVWYDRDETAAVTILEAEGAPHPRLTSWCTTVPHAVRHLMWVEPMSFDVGRLPVVGLDRDVHLLQGLPVTEAEYALLLSEGLWALQDRFRAGGADLTDLDRASVV